MNRLRIGLVHWSCLRPDCMHILCLGHVCFTVTLLPLTSRVEKRDGQNIFEQNFVERTFGIVGPARRRVQRVLLRDTPHRVSDVSPARRQAQRVLFRDTRHRVSYVSPARRRVLFCIVAAHLVDSKR